MMCFPKKFFFGSKVSFGAKKMKIALVSLHFAEYSLSLANALAKSHDVLLVLIDRNFNNEIGHDRCFVKEDRLQISILRHERSVLGFFRACQQLVGVVGRFQPDVIHCQEEPKDYLLASLPFWRRIPFVLTVHDPKPHMGVDAKRIHGTRRAWILRVLRDRANAIIVHGQHLKTVAVEAMPKKASMIHSVHHGPLGKVFSPVFDCDWEPGNCLFFGRIEAYKGLPLFISAIKHLREKGVQVTGVIAGRGSELAQFRPGLERDPGFRVVERYLSSEEVLESFRAANVVVMPYIEATQSGVSAYAIGMGRPVVATRVGGLPESVIDGVTGILVPSQDLEALADAIECVVNDQIKAKGMAAAAWDWGLGAMCWDNLAEETLCIYRSIARASLRTPAELST